jgi:hypothetical protein
MLVLLTGSAHTAQVALDVRYKHRHTHVREGLRQHLQGYGLTGTGGTGDEAVAVCHVGLQVDGLVGSSQPDFVGIGNIHKGILLSNLFVLPSYHIPGKMQYKRKLRKIFRDITVYKTGNL